MQQFYTDSSAAFSGENRLYNVAKDEGFTRKQVKEFLETKPSYTKHKKLVRNFKRNRVEARGINSVWFFDLADFSNLARFNDSYKWLFCLVDGFSKKGYVYPQKNKQGDTTLQSFMKVVDENLGEVCEFAYSDKGKEWVGITKYLKHRDITHALAEDPVVKASNAEAFIKTMKRLIFKYMTENKTFRFVDAVPKLVKIYNSRKHRSIGLSPNAVTVENSSAVRATLYPQRNLKLPLEFKYNVGDQVRVAVQYSAFSKAAYGTFSEEIYSIKSQLTRFPPCYKLEDPETEEPIRGVFYENELSRIRKT